MSRGHFVGIDYHRRLLSDSTRNQAFELAIEAQVKPGMVVYDVGTGTGLLALIAARAGAKKVYAIESTPIIQLAKKVAADNGYLDVIEFLATDSRTVDPPEPGDLLICECLGNFFVTDEMQPVVRDAVRFLKPSGSTIPRFVELKLAPVRLPLFEGINFYRQPCMGFDFSAAIHFALNRTYILMIDPEFVIGSSDVVSEFRLLEAPDVIHGHFELTIEQPALLEGLTGWFEVDLGRGTLLSTAPGIRTHWGEMVFPLEPIRVQIGDRIEGQLDLSVDPEAGKSRFRWWGQVVRQNASLASFDHNTDSRL